MYDGRSIFVLATKPWPKPHYYPEYRALARVHERAEDPAADMGRGGGTMVAPRLRSSSP